MRGSKEVKASDFYSPCEYFNVTVALLADPVKEDTTCTPEGHPGEAIALDEDPVREKSLNHTCRFMKNTDNCTHIFLHLEMDVKCKSERKLEEEGEFWYLYIKLRESCEVCQKSSS